MGIEKLNETAYLFDSAKDRNGANKDALTPVPSPVNRLEEKSRGIS
jgi:hypothetical protein